MKIGQRWYLGGEAPYKIVDIEELDGVVTLENSFEVAYYGIEEFEKDFTRKRSTK